MVIVKETDNEARDIRGYLKERERERQEGEGPKLCEP
jgi:hypothetical protein